MRPEWAPGALTRISATGMDRAGRRNARCVCLLGGRLRADDPKLVGKDSPHHSHWCSSTRAFFQTWQILGLGS
jgi:hypothetical protein